LIRNSLVLVLVTAPLTYRSVIAVFLSFAATCLDVDCDCLTSGCFDC
jgi:hypothetical protein